jgi:hypothetical protein
MPVIAPLWQTDPIRYLLNDKYPLHYTISLFDNKQSAPESNKVALQEMEDFRKSLEETPRDKLAFLIVEARQREEERKKLYHEKIEAAAFFNQPSSKADFDRWSRISYWTLEEGVALSFGKNPSIVSTEKLKTHRAISPFITNYATKLEEVRRAKVMGQLWESTIPFVFAKWAKRVGFEMPQELTTQVFALGVQILDWKEAFEKEVVEKAKLEKSLSDANQKIIDLMQDHGAFLEKSTEGTKAITSGFQENIAGRDQLIAQLKQEIKNLTTSKPVAANSKKIELGARERESLLKLVLGIAIKGYRYDPKATRSKEVLEITNDLQILGLGLTEDTVRKYLSEAKGLFAGVITEQNS